MYMLELEVIYNLYIAFFSYCRKVLMMFFDIF